MRVICFGEVMVELSLTDAAPDTAAIAFAGDTFNTAVFLKRQAPSLDVAYATKLGTDRFSDRIITMMTDEGLDISLVAKSPDRMPGLYAITTDAEGERSFTYWRDSSAIRTVFAPPALDLAALGRCDVLYFSAITLAILPQGDRDRLLQWLPQFRAQGGKVAFDSNYRPRLWPDVETARRDVQAAWRQTDIGLPSVDDEMDLFGDDNSGDVVSRIVSWGVKDGALKRGALGPVTLVDSVENSFPPITNVVDSTAAGDSFNAGYLAAKLTGQDANDCLRAGHALASKVIQCRGAIPPRGTI